MKIVWLIAAMMCLFTLPLHAASVSTEPRAGLEEKVIEHTLKNGMKLLMVERHTSPTVSAWIRFRVGSVDERSDERGIAHLLEHMLFKGTDRWPAGAADKAVAREGGTFNAMTWYDGCQSSSPRTAIHCLPMTWSPVGVTWLRACAAKARYRQRF